MFVLIKAPVKYMVSQQLPSSHPSTMQGLFQGHLLTPVIKYRQITAHMGGVWTDRSQRFTFESTGKTNYIAT